MRPVREIDELENARMVNLGGFEVLRRDPIEPEPVGTIVLIPFRVTRYRKDCDGSLIACLEEVDKNGEITGAELNDVGLSPHTSLVVTEDELRGLFDGTRVV